MSTETFVTWYRIADVVLKVRHPGGPYFDRLQRELGYYEIDGPAKPDGRVEIIMTESFAEPPASAVERAYRLANGEHGYMHRGADYVYRPGEILITFDYRRRRVRAAIGPGYWWHLVRHAIKWLIIKLLQKSGLTYIHGSAVRFAGRNVAFAGNQGAGKSSCMFRVRAAGGRVISDDNLLVDVAADALVPYTLTTNMKGDFKERFGIEEGWLYDIGGEVPLDRVPGGIDLLIVPSVWQSAVSEVLPMDRDEAVWLLHDSYRRELVYRAKPVSDARVRRDYERALADTHCFAFRAGTDEDEVQATLVGFLRDPLRVDAAAPS